MRKKVQRTISVVLAAALLLLMLPGNMAYASEDTTVATGNSVSEDTEVTFDENERDISAHEGEDNSAEVVSEESADTPSADSAGGNVNAVTEESTTAQKKSSSSAYFYRIEYAQTEINQKDVTVSLPNLSKIISANVADTLEISAVLNYNGKTYQNAEKTVDLSSLEENEFQMEFPTFGKYYVTATFSKNGEVVNMSSESVVGIVAEEYNFATLNATFPVVQFTLSLWDIKGTSENPVPTFVALSRSDAYDWNSLPENVYELPYIGDNNRTSVGFTNKVKMTANFIKELYELNPDSKFNVYCVDMTTTNYLWTVIENNIPTDQYTIRFLSDGTASYTFFNQIFNVENPQAAYDSLAAEWNNLRTEYANGNEVPLSSLQYATSSDINSLKYYTYVVAKEEQKKGVDVEWWLARTNGTLLSPDADFLAEACKTVDNGGIIRETAFKTMLENLQAKGPEVEQEFKTLYHFSETMFSDAEENGKQVMMLLGTRVNLESNFEDYARFCMLYYGDEYEYYYKGHPGTPTDMYPEKQAQLESLGIHDVESSIAAELILYFYPDISMSGYDSTTFISANKEMACCLFGKTLNQAYNVTNGCDYENTIDTCISEISDYGSGVGKKLNLNPEHRNYLVEFNKKVVDSAYDIAIWDATDLCIYYYVENEDGSYTMKATNVATRPVVEATGGEKQVSLSWNKVNGADEYRVYSYDESSKTYKGVKKLTGTSCTITGLEDGTKYTYLVRARVKGVWSSYTVANHVSATTLCAKPVFTVTGLNNGVTVSWKQVNGATKYRVYAYDTDTNKYTKIEDTTKTSVTYNDLNAGEEYTYLVRAYNGIDFSPWSRKDNVTGITLCKKPTVVATASTNSVRLSWDSVAGATRYRVYKYNLSTKKYTGLGNVKGNVYTVKELKSGTNYAYLVRAYNGEAYSSYKIEDNVMIKTLCSKPSVKVSAKGKTATVTWSSVKGATKYRVYAYNASTGKYTRLADTKNTSFTQTGLKSGTTYRYLVRAYNGTSFSSYSKNDVVKCTIK